MDPGVSVDVNRTSGLSLDVFTYEYRDYITRKSKSNWILLRKGSLKMDLQFSIHSPDGGL